MTAPQAGVVVGAGGLELAVDRWPDPQGQPVVLLHGGGQTRHAWGETGAALAARGYDVTSLDLRGHGESQWSNDGAYRLDAFRDDLRVVLSRLAAPAVLIGASLGGLAGLLVAGEGPREAVRALVLVDITHRSSPEGVQKIQAFMTANQDGFASLQAAADAVAAYLGHRPRPPDASGLMKNLRHRDGRLYWRWDPSFLAVVGDRAGDEGRLERAARAIEAPTLLVRGERSDIVRREDAEAFLKLVPQATSIEVKGAAHMVAGDQNTVFGEALLGFLDDFAPSGRH